MCKTPLIAGTSLETTDHNGARNGKREGLKTGSIGQSAAKILRLNYNLDMDCVQRLAKPCYTKSIVEGGSVHSSEWKWGGSFSLKDRDIVSSMVRAIAANITDKYYVYVLVNPKDNKPFYVGKGSGSRAVFHMSSFTKNWKSNKVKSILNEGFYPIIDIVFSSNDENKAFEEEKRLIKFYGRRDNNTGILTNHTDGGEGTSNRIYSEVTKKKISENHADFSGSNHPMYGKKHSKDTKKLIGLSSSKRIHTNSTKSKIGGSVSNWLKTEKGRKFISEKNMSGVKHPAHGTKIKSLIEISKSYKVIEIDEIVNKTGLSKSNLKRTLKRHIQNYKIEKTKVIFSGVGSSEPIRSLMKQTWKDKLADAESVLVGNAGRGKIAVLVVGREQAAVIQTLPGFQSLTDGNTLGSHVFGTIDGVTVIRVNEQALLDSKAGIALWKGASPFEAPVVYAPYMPLVLTATLPEAPNPLGSMKCAAVWAGVQDIVPNFATKFNMIES